MGFGRTSAHRHPFGCSACDFIRWGCQSEKSPLSWTGWVSIAHTALSGTGHTLADTQEDPPTAAPSRVAVDESRSTARSNGCMRRSISTRRYCLKSTCSAVPRTLAFWCANETHASRQRRRTDPAAPFLHRLTEKHEISDTEFLVDGGGYLTALVRREFSGQLNYTERNHIEKWFQTLTMRIDRFHTFWWGSHSRTERWLRRFRYNYNRYQPNQALDGRTPVEEVPN